MARPKSISLTSAELRLMEILWSRGAATVSDVVAELPADADLAYTTVLTTLRILEEKGYLSHEKQGRAFVYAPLVARAAAQTSAVKQVLDRFFGNRADLLVQNLLDNEELGEKEIGRLKKLIAKGDRNS